MLGKTRTIDSCFTNAGTRARRCDKIKEERYARGQPFHEKAHQSNGKRSMREKRGEWGAHTRFAEMVLLPSSKEEALNTGFPTTRGIDRPLDSIRDVKVQKIVRKLLV